MSTVVSRIKGVISPEPLTYMGGYAGTGKSTILPFILESLGFLPEKVAFVAPTGKAAKVMRQKLRAQQYPNATTGTIHSAIYRAKPAPISQLESDLAAHEAELDQALYESQGQKSAETEKQRKLVLRLREELAAAYREDKINFQLNPDSVIGLADLIVCDEASMVGKRMANDLMQFGVPVLAMGDPGQLPPVEDEPGLTAGEPDFFLTEIHRQAADNPIIHLATLARTGEDLPYGNYGDRARVMKRKDYQDYFDFEDRPMFLVGRNKTRWKTNQTLREEFGFVEKAGDPVGPQAGEPLIVTKNNREHPNLVNGTECVATSDTDIQKGDAVFTMSFEDEEGTPYVDKTILQGFFEENFYQKTPGYTCTERENWRAKRKAICMDFGLAITVHKSQGSQWDNVVLIDESSCFGRDEDKHLYTGITRAAETLVVLR